MDLTSRLKLLTFCSLFVLVVPDIIWERHCNQCVGGEYLKMRWLMQHDESLQSMAWVEAWYGTDCLAGKIKYIGCDGSCLTVEIYKNDVIKGVMKDCSDEMISTSPDLPADIDFNQVYRENASFKNTRLNHTIKYIFSTAGAQTSAQVVAELKQLEVPKKSREVKSSTIAFLFFAITLLVVVCIAFCWFGCKKNRRAEYARVHRFADKQTMVPSVASLQQAESQPPSNPSPEIQVLSDSV